MKKLFKKRYFFLVLILINTLFASWWIIDGNLFFHTDIARDFLLMEDIVDNKNLTLIGPRSGAIPGLFHGPLWLYLNTPSFLIGQGNPVVAGWFWVTLYLLSLIIIYFVGKKLFGEESGWLSVLLLSSVTILQVRSLFNPYGALLLSPFYLYFLIRYLQTKKIKSLLMSFFLAGLIIQFQMAFGIPVLILTVFYLIYYLWRIRKLKHILFIFVILIPLSSFLLFELRNNFLQIKSVLSYISGFETHGKLDLNMFQLISLRITELTTEGLGLLTQGNIYLTLTLLLFFACAIFLSCKKQSKNLMIYLFITYLYLGFWIFTIFFKGPVWNYYFLPFTPLVILLFAALKREVNKILFYAILITVLIINFQKVILDISSYNSIPEQQDVSTWKFNKLVAEKVFSGPEQEFGYFIFTPDLFGYPPRYALNFLQKRHLEKNVKPYKKEKITYLVIAPPPEYGKDPNSIWYQKNTNSTIWKNNDIRISRSPDQTFTFDNGFVIERYELSEEELKVEPNQYLIRDIFFR